MHIQYRPDTPRTTFESVDPLHMQWDYLENIGEPTTGDFRPTSSVGLHTTAVTSTTPMWSIPLDARKREYILYSRRLVRRHINFTYSQLNKKLPGAERFSGPGLVSALIRAGKDLDMVAGAGKMGNRSTLSLWHAVQYALRGEFITIEQATIRGCGPDAVSVPPSVASPSPKSAYPSPPPSTEDNKKKAKGKKIKKGDVSSGRTAHSLMVCPRNNLNTFGAKLLRLGCEKSAIKLYFRILGEPQNKGNSTTVAATTPARTSERTALSYTVRASTATKKYPPTSCCKPDTGTLPRALHTPENEFILPIPPLPLPRFIPTGLPLSPKRKSGRKKEFAGPEGNRISKRDLRSPLLRVRNMLSREKKYGATLTLAQARRKPPPEPMGEFKYHSELDSSGISGVLLQRSVYPDRPKDWGKKYLEEQRNDFTATLETSAAISGGKVRQIPFPGSVSPIRTRYRDPELPKESAGVANSTRLRQITFPDQPPSTPSSKYKANQVLLRKLPLRVVESVIACLKNPFAIFSKPWKVPVSVQLPVPTTAPQEVEQETPSQLVREPPKTASIYRRTPPPSKRKLSSMPDVEDPEGYGPLIPQKRFKGKLDKSGGGKFRKLPLKPNLQTPSEGRARESERKNLLEGLFCETERAAPTAGQTPPPGMMMKLSPITNARDLPDPESPLVQKKWRIRQEIYACEGTGELPLGPDSEAPGSEGGSRNGRQRKRMEGLICATERAAPAMAQTPPPSSMMGSTPITNVGGFADPESPLLQKEWRVKQWKSICGKIDEPLQQKQNMDTPGGELESLEGVRMAPQLHSGNDEGKALLASGTSPTGYRTVMRVAQKRKRADFEDLSKYGDDFFRSAKRVRE